MSEDIELGIDKPKRKKGKSATSRTLEKLRAMGATAQVVERWQKTFSKNGGPPGVRIDLFGCVDIVALMEGCIFGIQSTTGSNHSEHIKKCLAEPRLRQWLECGGRFQAWSWSKRSAGRGTGKHVWACRIDEITAATKAAESPQQAQEEPELFGAI